MILELGNYIFGVLLHSYARKDYEISILDKNLKELLEHTPTLDEPLIATLFKEYKNIFHPQAWQKICMFENNFKN